MPELPEVETIRRDLARVLRGQRVVSFAVKRPKLLRNPRRAFSRYLVGSTITNVERRGKQLIFKLNSGYSLLIHLKMTGQLVWKSSRGKISAGGHPIAGVAQVPNRYTYIVISLGDKSNLYFNDVRQFGYFHLVPTNELAQVFRKLSPEPLSRSFTFSWLDMAFKRRGRTTVKAAILDQGIAAGIGNIYADESLFVARIKPSRRVSSLSEKERQALWRAIRGVLRRAVQARGTSFNSYRDGLGRQGTYWARRLAYGRAGQACVRCRHVLQRSRVAGRGTTHCDICQR